MKFQVMELIIRMFALEHHLLHVGLKVWETKPAVWLTQSQMPDNDQARSWNRPWWQIHDL